MTFTYYKDNIISFPSQLGLCQSISLWWSKHALLLLHYWLLPPINFIYLISTQETFKLCTPNFFLIIGLKINKVKWGLFHLMSYCGRGDLILERCSGIGKEKKRENLQVLLQVLCEVNAKSNDSSKTPLIDNSKLTPCSLADCERGFGLMNLIVAPTCTRLKALYVSMF